MYELTVQTVFSAAHALLIAGVREPVHGHDWHVTVSVVGDRLDDDGLLVDFHALERIVNEVVGPFRNANLNEVAPFDRRNPSAENVASHICEAVGARLGDVDGRGTTPGLEGAGSGGMTPKVSWVRVTEAPGCAVTYFKNRERT